MAMNDDPNVVLCLEKINELEDMIETSPVPRFGGNADRRIIDVEEVFNLLGDLKVTIPEDVRKADSIIADSRRIMEKAESYASEVENSAKTRSDSMISEAESKRDSIIATAEANASSKIAMAEAEAKRIIAEAEAERVKILDEHDITVEAQRRAERLKNKAEVSAKTVYENAKLYADEVLGSLMEFLERYYNVIEENRNDLGAVKKPNYEVSPDEARQQEAAEAKAAQEETEEEEEDNRADGILGFFKRRKKKTEDDDTEEEE